MTKVGLFVCLLPVVALADGSRGPAVRCTRHAAPNRLRCSTARQTRQALRGVFICVSDV